MREANQTEYESPFPGINPFSFAYKDVFFARESEIRSLIRLIVMYRGVLLFSDSGAGKSSLINAGIIPIAINEGYQVERVRVQPKKGEEIVVERLSEKFTGGPPFLPSIFASREQHENVVVSVEEFERMLRPSDSAVRSLLIFDQFEEWITLFEAETSEEAKTAQENIRDMISSLINDRKLPIKVLIVLREDYLAKLEPLIEKCPKLPDQYLRLTPLSGDQIYQAIRGPFEKYPVKYKPEISESLAKEIREQLEKESEGADIRLAEVQIVCQNLFKAGIGGQKIKQYFDSEGGVPGILEQYWKGTLEKLETDQQYPAVGLLTRMVTPAGTRNTISENDLLSRVEVEDNIPRELLSEVLYKLYEDTKLVRRERRRDVYYYEIASEFLAGWIQKQAQKHKRLVELEKLERKLEEERQKEKQRLQVEAERERAEQAQQLAEEKTRSARRRLVMVAALAVMFVVAAMSAGVAFKYYVLQKGLTDEQRRLTDEAEALSDKLKTFMASNMEQLINELKKNPATRDKGEQLEQEWKEKLQEIETSKIPRTLTPTEWVYLRDLIETHNEVFKKFSECYLLDDKQTNYYAVKFNPLYDKLKDSDKLETFFAATASTGKDFKELRARIQKLNDIRDQRESKRLVEIAETAEHTEAVYAAWIKLGDLKEPPWPSKREDLVKGRDIRDRLNTGFKAIRSRDEERGNSLLQELARTGLQREVIFIERKNSLPDKVLGKFCGFAVDKISRDTPGGPEKLDDLVRRLADFVSDPNWPKKFRMDLMAEKSPLYEKTDLTEMDFEKWLSEVKGYRVLERDQRQRYLQKQIIQEIRENIEKVSSYLPDKEKEFQQRLIVYQLRIQKLLEMPAIVKNETYINNAVVELKDIGKHLARLKLDSTPLGIPSWLSRVSVVSDATGGKFRITLKSKQFGNKFIPLSTSDKQPMVVDQINDIEHLREDFVEEEYELDSSLNAGWPKYTASSEDPSVVLRFIPAGPGNPEPFYMATHEITYVQYARFLQSYGAIPVGLGDQCKYGAEGRTFLWWTDGPSCPIEWNGRTFVIKKNADGGDFPVTYVTYDGAQSYAKWLGAQLPDSEQHRYACRAGTTSKYPWGENLSGISSYAHVRGTAWQQAAKKYNENKDSLGKLAILPIGAVQSDEDYMNDSDPGKKKWLISNRVVAEGSPPYANRSFWPIANITKQNNWGLYDMIGNVWEWCQGESICGGSCLAPPEYITNASMYSKSFKSQNPRQQAKANDVGFRVVVPAE